MRKGLYLAAIVLGLGMGFVSIFPWTFGIHTVRWSPRRIGLLLAGCSLLIYGLIFRPGSYSALWASQRLAGMKALLPPALLAFLDLESDSRKEHPLQLSSVAIWLFCSVPAMLLTLHMLGIVPVSWERKELDAITHFDGFAYQTQMPSWNVKLPALGESPVIVDENHTRLPFKSGSGYGVVVKLGRGRYYVSEDTIFFSTSDNTDPRSNGRKYHLNQPTPVPLALTLALTGLALLSTAGFAIRYRFRLLRMFAQPPFSLAALLYIFFFLINRLWFFIDMPVPAIHPDSGSYYAVAEQIGSGSWANLGMRPPAYPLLMKIVYSVSDRVMTLVFVQNLLSLGSGLLMIYAVYKTYPRLVLWAAFSMAFYFYGVVSMEHDTSLLSESLYTSLLVYSFALLILGLRKCSSKMWLALSSAVMAAVILTRPAGMFLLVTYMIILGFLWLNRFGVKSLVYFGFPLPILLLATCFYNWLGIGVFSVTTWGEANLAVGTFTFWEKDESYPREVNYGIDEIQTLIKKRFAQTGKEPEVLNTSWDPVRLGPIFVEGFNGPALDVAMRLGGRSYEVEGRKWIRKISADSIRKHPQIYGKFVFTMLCLYYAPYLDFDFREYLKNRVLVIYVDKRFSKDKGNSFMVRLAKEFADSKPPKAVVITSEDPNAPMALNDRVTLSATPLWRAYYLFHIMRRMLSWSIFWPLAYTSILIWSTFALVRAKGRNVNAFILFILTISAFGASLVVSLVEFSQPRYSEPMAWVYYLSVALSPMLSKINNAKAA